MMMIILLQSQWAVVQLFLFTTPQCRDAVKNAKSQQKKHSGNEKNSLLALTNDYGHYINMLIF